MPLINVVWCAFSPAPPPLRGWVCLCASLCAGSGGMGGASPNTNVTT